MKLLHISIGLLATAILAAPIRAQEATEQKESKAPAAAQKESAALDKDKDAVPEEVVPEKEAIKQLVGDYQIVSGVNSGEEVLPERLEDVTVRFTEKTVTTYDGEKNERFSASYRLNTQQRPWRIGMTSKPRPSAAGAGQNGTAPAGTTSEGLIEIVDGADGRVRVIYALPGGLAPKSFQTGERQQMFVLKRLADPIEKAEQAKAESASEDKKK